MATQTVADVGAGSTLAFATSGITLRITSMTLGDSEYDVIETTYLGTTVAPSTGSLNSREFIFGSHVRGAGLDVTYHWDWDVYASMGIKQTVTLTDPDGNTISGTGGISKVSGPTYDVDGLLVGTAHVAMDGAWAPPVGT